MPFGIQQPGFQTLAKLKVALGSFTSEILIKKWNVAHAHKDLQYIKMKLCHRQFLRRDFQACLLALVTGEDKLKSSKFAMCPLNLFPFKENFLST